MLHPLLFLPLLPLTMSLSLEKSSLVAVGKSDLVDERNNNNIFGGFDFNDLFRNNGNNLQFWVAVSLLSVGGLGLLLFSVQGRRRRSGVGARWGYSRRTWEPVQGPGEGATSQLGEFTDHLNILAEAFAQYEVEDPTCQLYVACEAAHTDLHLQHGELAQTVYQVMENIGEPVNSKYFHEDAYLMDILDAFKIGASGQSCSHIRKSCRNERIFKDD